MKSEITGKQMKLYNTIKNFIDENGYAPTIRELNKITHIKSTATTHSKLVQLKKKGYISYIVGKSRTIRLLK